MLIKYFYDDELAQASYLVGCTASGTALVIDPARNIQPYLELAAKHGLSIDKVTETHIHADFVSGTRELAHATGATMLLSDEGGEGWRYQFPAGDTIQLLRDGDQFMVGNITFDVLHTPGHTPEHITFMVTDNGADHPMGLFTGDFVFVGDVGRPDLLEEAAGQIGTREVGAQQQFANIERLKQMPDYLQIWPGHGAGSSCGKALGAIPSTTLGYEKLFNPAFQFNNENAFVAWLLEGQPEAPKYFAQMKKVNKAGAALLSTLHQPQQLDHVSPDMMVIDTRSTDAFAKQHIPNTINIPANSSNFSTYAGWYVNFDEPIQLIVATDQLDAVLSSLRAVGVDKVAGYATPSLVKAYDGTVRSMTPQEIYDAGIKILDVRATTEYHSEHIPNVQQMHMGYVPDHLTDISRDEPLAVHCGGGLRSQIVISILQKAGYENLINMTGGISAWQKAGLPLE